MTRRDRIFTIILWRTELRRSIDLTAAETRSSQPCLFTDKFFDNPYPTYKILRSTDPIHWNEQESSWLITRYQDVYDLSADPRLSAKRDKREISQLPKDQRERIEPLRDFFSNWLLYADSVDHLRLRRSVSKLFTPANIRSRKND